MLGAPAFSEAPLSATPATPATLPNAPLPAVTFNNYQFVRVGDGMGTGERIR